MSLQQIGEVLPDRPATTAQSCTVGLTNGTLLDRGVYLELKPSETESFIARIVDGPYFFSPTPDGKRNLPVYKVELLSRKLSGEFSFQNSTGNQVFDDFQGFWAAYAEYFLYFRVNTAMVMVVFRLQFSYSFLSEAIEQTRSWVSFRWWFDFAQRMLKPRFSNGPSCFE